MTAPNAPLLTSPIDAAVVDVDTTTRFTWTFSDPDPGDSQSEFDLRYRVIGAGAWTDINQTTTNEYRDVAGGTFTADDFEWQVRTYDALGAVGPYSASEFFTAADVPSAPTITAPADAATVDVTETATWTAASQTHYQVRTVADASGSPDTSTVYTDTGTVASIAGRSSDLAFAVNNRWEHVQVRIMYAGLWSTWASHRVHAAYTSPVPGTLVVTAEQATASLLVETTEGVISGGEPVAESVDVYVKDVNVRGYGDRLATGVVPTGVWRWWLPVSGVDYDVRTLTHGVGGATSWSVYEYPVLEQGGTPTTVHTLIRSGGGPSTIHTTTQDGGVP